MKEVRAWTVKARLDRAAGRGGDPHRFREGLHPRRNHRLRRLHQVQGRVRCPRRRPPAPGRQGIPWSRKATCCTSASTSEPATAVVGGPSARETGIGASRKLIANALTTSPGSPKIAGSFGGIPKRPTGADCKSAGLRLRWFESTSLHQLQSGPVTGLAAGRNIRRPYQPSAQVRQAGVVRRGSSSMVEPQPSKLIVRVRFPSPAPLNARDVTCLQQLRSRSSVGRAPPW